MIEIEEFDDSDAENIIEEIHKFKLNFTFFPSISTGFIRRLKKGRVCRSYADFSDFLGLNEFYQLFTILK